jgi:outer membrane protein insertion porin family
MSRVGKQHGKARRRRRARAAARRATTGGGRRAVAGRPPGAAPRRPKAPSGPPPARSRPRLLAAAGLLAAAVLATVGPAPSRAALDLRDGLTVERVEIVGCRFVDAALVREQIRVRAGDVYRREDAEADAKRILALGFFTNVRVDAATGRTGVILTYAVDEKRQVERIVIRGNAHVSEERLVKAANLKTTTAIDDLRLKIAAGEMEKLYRERGYPFAKVTGVIESVEGAPAAVFHVREGDHVRVTEIVFHGNTAFSDRALRQVMETATYAFLFRKGRFHEDVVKEDARRVRQFYLEQGFLDAEVSADWREARGRVTVEVFVREGEPYLIGRVEVRGAKVFAAAEIEAQMGLKPGVRYTAAGLLADRRAVERFYGRHGYLTTKVAAETRFTQAAHVVNLVVDVAEGPQVRILRIVPEGNNKTKDYVLLREFRQHPGDVADVDRLEESRRRLLVLRFFDDVKVERLEGPNPNEKDLIVEVTESRTADVMFGVGYGTETGLMGSISYVQRNFDIGRWPRSFRDFTEGTAFAGAGQTLRLVAQPGTEVQEYLAEFREPHLFGTEFNFGLRGYYYQRLREVYIEGRLGAQVSVGRRLPEIDEALNAEIALRVEGVDISHLGARAPRDVLDVAGRSTLTSARFTVSHDTRDDWLDPTRGHRYVGAVEQAGAMGGDYTFTRLSATADWHVPLFEWEAWPGWHVLNLGARAGYILSDAPTFERFYAGGTYVLRGFRYRGVGPRVNGFPVGGEFLAAGTVEYTFPIYEKVLRGVVFSDFGTVEPDLEIGTIRSSAGFGLRLVVPALGPIPMQFNFGFPITKARQDRTELFSFAIGTQF